MVEQSTGLNAGKILALVRIPEEKGDKGETNVANKMDVDFKRITKVSRSPWTRNLSRSEGGETRFGEWSHAGRDVSLTQTCQGWKDDRKSHDTYGIL